MKTTAKKKGWKHSREVERLWDGVPVQDATGDLRVIIKPCDVKNASTKDPGHCVFARACKRSFGTKKVLFLRTIAYVEVPDENGSTRVERFIMSEAVCQLVRNFDMGDKVIPNGGFLLLAPHKALQLENMRSKQAKQAKKKREALLRGEKVKRVRKSKGRESRDKPKLIDLEVRNGSGMVHFT